MIVFDFHRPVTSIGPSTRKEAISDKIGLAEHRSAVSDSTPAVAIMFYGGMSNIRPVTAALPASDQLWALAGFGLTLGDAVRRGGHLRARCRCGRHGPIDVGYWLARRWEGRPLADLEDRVRCACGSRRVMLEVAIGPVVGGAAFYVPA